MAPTQTELQNLLLEQHKELERIANDPMEMAYVLYADGVDVYLSRSTSTSVVPAHPKLKLAVGDAVLLYPETGAILKKAMVFDFGESVTVTATNDKTSEVDVGGNVLIVLNGSAKVEKGDRVILDSKRQFIIKNNGKDTSAFQPEKIPDITWDDIGGLEDAKAEMIEAIELPHTNKEIFAYYKKKPVKGILMDGPPGCGKTMLGKAAANALAKIYKAKNAPSGFLYVKGPEILNKYVGESEATIRSLFLRAKEHSKQHGFPMVIFIDEADALLVSRSSREGSSAFMSSTIVPMFLAEMDGLNDSDALVILATNRPQDLDPAIVREGRIDRKVHVSRPTFNTAIDILKLNLDKIPLHKGEDIEDLSANTARLVFSSERVIQDGITLSDAVSGAMLASLVDQAVSVAMRRDLKSGKKTGVSMPDMAEAVERVTKGHANINHEDVKSSTPSLESIYSENEAA